MPKNKQRAKVAEKQRKQRLRKEAQHEADALDWAMSQQPDERVPRFMDMVTLMRFFENRKGWSVVSYLDDDLPAWDYWKTSRHPTTGEKQRVRTTILCNWDEDLFVVPPVEPGETQEEAIGYDTAASLLTDIEAIEALVPWVSPEETYRGHAPDSPLGPSEDLL